MKKYKNLEIEVVYFQERDMITCSIEDSTDDFGQWNDGWFVKNND